MRLSLEGKFVYIDGKSSSSLGYSSLELLGKSYFEYIHVDDLDKIEDSFGKCMSKFSIHFAHFFNGSKNNIKIKRFEIKTRYFSKNRRK